MNKPRAVRSAFLDDPEVMSLLAREGERTAFLDSLRELFKGEDGKTPVKGKDYFTKQDIEEIKQDVLKGATPVKFKDYFTESEILWLMASIREGLKDEVTPKKGVDYFDGTDGKNGKELDENAVFNRVFSNVVKQLPDVRKMVDAELTIIWGKLEERLKDVKSVKDIVAEIKKKKLIAKQDINGMTMTDQRWHGGGDVVAAGTNVTITTNSSGQKVISASGGGGGLTEIVVSGIRDDSNVTFTALSEPSYLVINGAWYKPTGGAITWSYLAGTITLSSPVGTGGAIWGF